MKKKSQKSIVKELKNKLEHAEKSRDDNYAKYLNEYNKVKSLEEKLKERQYFIENITGYKENFQSDENHRLMEIIRWLINKETAIIKDIYKTDGSDFRKF